MNNQNITPASAPVIPGIGVLLEGLDKSISALTEETEKLTITLNPVTIRRPTTVPDQGAQQQSSFCDYGQRISDMNFRLGLVINQIHELANNLQI